MVTTMKNKHARSIAVLGSVALALATSPALATTWFSGSAAPIASPSDVQLDAVAQRAALDHVFTRSAELDLVGVELGADRVIPSARGSRLVRLEQRVSDVPVLGGGVIVKIESDGSVRRIGVDVARHLDVDTDPSLDVQAAQDALELALGRAVPAPARAKLVVSRMGAGILLWQLDVRDTFPGSRYWVDAHHGDLVASRSHGVHALGTVYEMNPIETPIPIDVELPLLDTAADPIHLNGWGGLLAVTQYVSGGDLANNYNYGGIVVEQTLVPSSGEDFLYPPLASPLDPTDAFAHVSAYYHLSTIRALFADLGATVDNPNWKLTVIANALADGQPFEDANASAFGIEGAFAAPNVISLGQTSISDTGHDADVIKHELAHIASFVEIGSNLLSEHIDELGRSPFSGAIDEGIADYFACSQNGDPEMGEGSFSGFRDLNNTSKTCPDDMNAEPHDDGEIIGSACWSIRALVGSDVADRLVWGALSLLLPGGSFGDFAQGLLATADDLVAAGDLAADDRAGIEDILAQRGLDNCGRIIRLSPGDTHSVLLAGLTSEALSMSGCALMKELGVEVATMFHFSWTPAPGDLGLMAVAHVTPGAADLDYTIFARANQPVRFAPAGLLGFVMVDQSDYSAAHTGEDGELVIDASSDPPFDPEATYDFVVMSRSCDDLTLEFSVTPYEPTTGEGGSGDGATDEDSSGDGCGCELAGEEAPVPGSLALVALGAALARRRRHQLKKCPWVARTASGRRGLQGG